MPGDNKSIMHRMYEEVWNKRRLEVADELVAPSHALHDDHLPESGVGPEAYKRTVASFIRAFPDLHFTVEDMVAENDKVVAFWNISGTHKGEFRGIAPTGKKVSVDGITISQIANGKIMDSYLSWDMLGMLQQLGAIPPLGKLESASAG